MNKTNDFKYNLPAYSDPVDIEDLNDNFRGIDDALMAGLCKKDYTGNNMGSSDPSARKYAWAPWLEIVNDNEFDVVVTDRNAPVESEEATINIAAGQTFRKYINGRYYMNFYVQDQHDVTFKWFTNAETRINEIEPSGGGGVSSVNVTGASSSHIESSGGPVTDTGTIELSISEGYSIPQTNKQTAWDSKAADLKLEINSSTFVITAQLKDASGNLIGNERTIDLPLEEMVVDAEYDPQTQKIKLELKNGNYVEFSVAELVSGLQTELSASNKLNPEYIAYDASHRAVSDTEKSTWNSKQNAISDLATIRSGATAGATAVQPSEMEDALDEKQDSLSETQLAAVNSGINNTKVAQISANQTNILYAIRNGVKNQLKLTGDVWNPNTLYVYWDYENGTVRVTGSTATTDTVFLNLGTWTAPEDGVYRIFANSAACTANIRVYDNGNWNTYTAGGYSNEATWTKGTTRTIYVRIAKGVVVSDVTITPMICQKSVFDADPTFAPYSAPNSDLTWLQAEDRAALAEVVDSGAKNLLDTSLAAIKANGNNVAANISWNNNVGTVPNTGVSFTVNANGTITVNTNGAASARANLYFECHLPATTNNVNYTLSSGGAYSAGAYYIAMFNQSESSNPTASPTTNFSSKGGSGWMCYLSVLAGTTVNNITFSPMCCTKAAFGVSKAFVPYRPNYDFVCEYLPKTTKGEYSVGTAYALVSGLPITFSKSGTYRVSAYHSYSHAVPQGLIISRSDTDYTASINILAKTETTSDVAVLSTSVNVQTMSGTSYYIWVKAKTASTNQIGVTIEYLG